jgi:hypothetical protein
LTALHRLPSRRSKPALPSIVYRMGICPPCWTCGPEDSSGAGLAHLDRLRAGGAACTEPDSPGSPEAPARGSRLRCCSCLDACADRVADQETQVGGLKVGRATTDHDGGAGPLQVAPPPRLRSYSNFIAGRLSGCRLRRRPSGSRAPPGSRR